MTRGGWRWMPKKLKATKNHNYNHFKKKCWPQLSIKKKKEFTTIKNMLY